MSSDIFQLFDCYKCDNFPYVDKDGNYNWQYNIKNINTISIFLLDLLL